MMSVERARQALQSIPPDLPRKDWVRAGMAAQAAGLGFEDFDAWSAGAPNYAPRATRDTWRSFKPGRGIGPGTLFELAKQHGLLPAPSSPHPGRESRTSTSSFQFSDAGTTFEQFAAAGAQHPYVAAKAGVPDGLRVVPDTARLRIGGVSMAGALVVPLIAAGAVTSMQFITVGATADRLRAAGRPTKLNLPGHPMRGWFTVGKVEPDSTVYLCEGIGQAWACWKAAGCPAVVCFGWGRLRSVAAQLRARNPAASLVVVPDVGKESDAEKIAADMGLRWVRMPAGWPQNADVNDLALRDGFDALRTLLAAPVPPMRAEPRMLDFRVLAVRQPPPRHWFVPGWLSGPTLIAAAGGMGKSMLVQQQATLGALGRSYIAEQEAPFTSLVVNCEDDHDEVWRRQAHICAHEGIDMASLAGRLHIVSRVGCDNALMAVVQGSLAATPFMEQLRQQVNDLRVDVLVLDNVAHMFLGDHDDRTHATAFINAICALVVGRPFAPLLVAHVSRAQGSEFTGSVAWENAVRMRWFLGNRLPLQSIRQGEEQPDTSRLRFLCKRKSNYSAQDFVRFTVTEGGLLVPNHAAGHVRGMVAKLDEDKAEEVCLAGFMALRVMGLHPSDSKASPDYLPRQLVEKRQGGGYCKQDLANAMNRLMAAGTFARGQVSTYSNRTLRMGLILTSEAA